MNWLFDSNVPPNKWDPLPAQEVAQDFHESGLPYRVDSLIGFGAQAAVYAAIDTRNQRRVAVKMLRYYAAGADPEPNQDSDYFRRFKTEIAALQRVKHSNVVEILDPGGKTAEGYDYFVMEFLDGQPLSNRLSEQHNLTLKQGSHILTEICNGLDAIHAAGLVHRDLKPSNIFLCKDGRIVVLDLGVAKDLTRIPSTLSQTKGSPGTPGYVAPEVKKGGTATTASDIYAIGVIILEISAGELPEVGHKWPSEFGWNLDSVVKKALGPEPGARYPTAAEVRSDIEEAMAEIVVDRVTGNSRVPPFAAEVPSTGSSAHLAPSQSTKVRRIAYPDVERKKVHRAFLANWKPANPDHVGVPSPLSQHETWKVEEQWAVIPGFPTFETTVRRLTLRKKLRFRVAATLLSLSVLLGIAGAVSEGDPAPISAAIIAGVAFGGVGFAVTAKLYDWFLATFAGCWDFKGENSFVIGEYWRQFAEPALLDPHQIFWHPSAPYVFASRDHENLVSWHTEEKYRDGPHVNSSKVFTVGSIQRIYFSESIFMTQAQSFWWWRIGSETNHWFIYSRNGERRHSMTGSEYSGVFGQDGKSNPFRPGGLGSEQLLMNTGPGWMGILDVSTMPVDWYFSVAELKDRAKVLLDLAGIRLAENEVVDNFAWHPSGLYLALKMGGRLHVLHFDNAELIASYTPSNTEPRLEISGWNVDGTLLALDQTASLVWDARTDEVRSCKPSEQWLLRAPGSLDSKLTSCDGLRRFSGFHGVVSPAWKAIGLEGETFTDVAWSPQDPNVFVSLGGQTCPRDIRVWRREQS